MGPAPRALPPEAYLGTAEGIGHRICREAFWSGDRCNWMGAEPRERIETGLTTDTTTRSLGPDLYSGTSGVALFLAELFAVAGGPTLRDTALGAIRHALSRSDAVPVHSRLGLFTGWIGIALAATRLALLLEVPSLSDRARLLLQRAKEEERHQQEFDIVSGRAGAVAGLIVLNRMLADPSLLDFAALLGDELLETAARSDSGYSWASRGLRTRHNLTGYSHGASGAGYALLELHQATGVETYRSAALAAFAYERRWFDPGVDNWPDFRPDLHSGNRGRSSRAFAEYWCHGAPGIALSRLRAFQWLRDETSKVEALAGLRATSRMIDLHLVRSDGNFSLCHGLLGNAGIIDHGRRVLGAESVDDRLVTRVARTGVEQFSESDSPWPCGTHVGETPNLMLGLSGIGHSYLRLYRPNVPSLLLLMKEEWPDP